MESQVLALIERLDQVQRDVAPRFPISECQRNWTEKDRLVIEEHYRDLAITFPDAQSRASDIGDEEMQRSFFQDLMQIGDLHGSTILDLGAGSGALLDRLQACGVGPKRYVGVEISEIALERARREHPGAEFVCVDCFDHDPFLQRVAPKSFDYILASGLFGVRPRSWSEQEFNALALAEILFLASLPKKGLAFNFIPHVYPPLRSLLEWKEDTGHVVYHRMNRVQMIDALERRNLSVRLLPATLLRLLVQVPVLIHP